MASLLGLVNTITRLGVSLRDGKGWGAWGGGWGPSEWPSLLAGRGRGFTKQYNLGGGVFGSVSSINLHTDVGGQT